MAHYRKLIVHEVGTDTYVDCDANVSRPRNDLIVSDLTVSFSITESLEHVLSIPVSSRTIHCVTRSISTGQDLCAISYDDGTIRLYSTYDNTLTLVRGTQKRRSRAMDVTLLRSYSSS